MTNPNSYLLQAITNPGKEVFIGSWESTQFDEMVSTYKINNVEIDSKYYRINVYSKDVFFWRTLFLLSIAGWVALEIAVIVWKLITHAHVPVLGRLFPIYDLIATVISKINLKYP